MPITVGNTSPGGQALSSPLTYTHTHDAGTDDVLMVAVRKFEAQLTGVTYNGVAMTNVGQDSNGSEFASLWLLVAPTSGANTVEISWDTGSRAVAVSVSYHGVDQTTPNRTATTANGSSATASATATNTVADDWVIEATDHANDSDSTHPAGETERTERNVAGGGWGSISMADLVATGASTQMDTSFTSASWVQILVPLIPAGAPVTGRPRIRVVSQAVQRGAFWTIPLLLGGG